jgi:nucleoside-diphosphate-sugar epimerase
LAGKAHVVNSKSDTIDKEYQEINVNLTMSLARQAVVDKVRRFIFISSIGVNGNKNTRPFLESDSPNPKDEYAISKYEAERELLDLANNSDLEVVIIRPPLVYGADAPGNFGRLLKWANSKFLMPLPLGLVKNKRSLIAIENLNDFIITCIMHDKAKNEVFLIDDGVDYSTTEILQIIARAFNKKALLLPIPTSWMLFMARFFDKDADINRLFSSLQVDSSKARDLLDWHPKVTFDKQMEIIANETVV